MNENGLNHKIKESVDKDLDVKEANIFVFTPERVLQLLAQHPEIKIDFFFYDEVYKIDEDFDNNEGPTENKSYNLLHIDRTKTFRIVLYLLSKMVPEFYLAGPNLDSKNFGNGMKRFLKKYQVNVKEITFEPTLRIETYAFRSKIEEQRPYAFKYLHPEDTNVRLRTKKQEKMVDVVNYIKGQNQGKTLFYCNAPGKINKYASNPSLIKAKNEVNDARLQSFINHIYDTYNIKGSSRNWSLIRILKSGIGVHHGALPRYIQREILYQFNKGNFNFLFCTSTIIEGVNTDAKNTVILNSSKGNAKLTAFDIKNISGRAGRYYHNFIGRIYYTERELLNILNSGVDNLNFITFDDEKLENIDLDNADLSDLSDVNIDLKQERIEIQNNYLLPREIFEKNRLVPYQNQECLFKIISEESNFTLLKQMLSDKPIIESFKSGHTFDKLLSVLEEAHLINNRIKSLYYAIGSSYLTRGFKGILDYQIEKNKDVDSAYLNAFRNMRGVIEYEIPRALSLFESIFAYVAEIKGHSTSELSLSKVISYFETGVKSPFGSSLVQYGFPVDTVRRIESKFSDLVTMDTLKGKVYYFSMKNEIDELLDDYEKRLIGEAVIRVH